MDENFSLDSLFVAALKDNTALMQDIGGRLYDTRIVQPHKDSGNTPAPYILVTFDGLANGYGTKDNDHIEATEDTVTVGVEIAAATREALATMAADVRKTLRDYVAESTDDGTPTDYRLRASAVDYDDNLGCFYQKLTYECTVDNDYD